MCAPSGVAWMTFSRNSTDVAVDMGETLYMPGWRVPLPSATGSVPSQDVLRTPTQATVGILANQSSRANRHYNSFFEALLWQAGPSAWDGRLRCGSVRNLRGSAFVRMRSTPRSFMAYTLSPRKLRPGEPGTTMRPIDKEEPMWANSPCAFQ